MTDVDVVIVGGGPAGLSTAESLAQARLRVIVLEQNAQIGSPVRTSGGSFIQSLVELGIPDSLYHPITKGRILSPTNSVEFEYGEPLACVMDVRGVFQYLAERAILAGAELMVSTSALEPLIKGGYVVGIRAKDYAGKEFTIRSNVTVDATGYKATISRQAEVHSGFYRFGVGAEYDLYAPCYDQEEAVLIVGSQVAPSGYAWAFPWGRNRLRLGVGIIHADSRANPNHYLSALVDNSEKFGIDLHRANPIEYHYGLIPSDGLSGRFTGNGVLSVGDAAGHSSALAGEGIRWAIEAGRLAGQVISNAFSAGDFSRIYLKAFERKWKARHGINLFIAHELNKTASKLSDNDWDDRIELMKLLTPDQYAQAMQTNFMAAWAVKALLSNPALAKWGFEQFVESAFSRLRST